MIRKEYRVLSFAANKAFTNEQLQDIKTTLSQFLPTWKAHGNALEANFRIEYGQFLLIIIDQEQHQASGCSIDSLQRTIAQLDTKYMLGFFDRMKACYRENEEVKSCPLQEFRRKRKTKEIPDNIEVFDFSKSSSTEFFANFLLPLEKSWAKSI